MKLAEWVRAFEIMKSKGLKVVHVSSLKSLSKQDDKTLPVSLWRLERLGLVTRITRGWICIGDCDIWDVVKRAFPSAYISLEWALHYHDLIDQEVLVVTLAWLGKPKTILGKRYTFEFHRIRRSLYFGFDDRMIAEPEKALLDILYVRNRVPNELNLDLIDVGKFVDYSRRYPKRIRERAQELVRQIS